MFMMMTTVTKRLLILGVCFLSVLFVGRVMADPTPHVLDFEPGEIIAHIPGEAETLAVQGDYAYVGFENDLVVIDIADKTAPVEVGRLGIGEKIHHLAVSGQYAYLATTSGLQVIEISHPANPVWQAIYEEYLVTEVQIRKNLAYILSKEGLRIIDITNAPYLGLKGKFDVIPSSNLSFQPHDLDVLEKTVFLLGNDGLYIVNAFDPSKPLLDMFLDNFGRGKIHVTKTYLLSTSNSCSSTCVTVFGVRTLEWNTWAMEDRYSAQTTMSMYSEAVTADDLYAYVGKDVGLYVYNYHRDTPYPIVSIFEMADIRDIVVREDYIYAAGIESDDYFNPPRLGGFYILSPPPLFNSYLPLVVQ